MKNSLFITVLLFSNIFLFSQNSDNFNCYTIIVGKDASFDGSVLLGHNEDDNGSMLINWFKVPEKKFRRDDSLTLLNKTKIKQIQKTNSYIRFQVSGEKFGDAYMNEHSVTICSNACMSKEDTATGNIGYDFRRLLAERAKTAKEAVILGGKLIEEFGYESSGRTYSIADNQEAWMLSAVKGKRWMAQRIPDDHMAIIPNYYTIQEVDLNDSSNYLASSDIISYAVTRGWYDTTSVFNFREVYGDSLTNHADYNVPRHLFGMNYFSDHIFTESDTLAFSFKQKVTIEDLKSLLSSHFENSEYCKLPENKNPHQNFIRPICVQSTQFSFVAQLRSDMPVEIGSLIWISPYNGCIFPYIPIYWNIYNTDKRIRFENFAEAEQIHFVSEKNQLNMYPEHAYFAFQKYMDYIELDYEKRIQDSKVFKLKIEDELKRNQNNLEESVLLVYESYPDDTKKILTAYYNQYFERILNHIELTVKTKK